jgi:hypothetical protein
MERPFFNQRGILKISGNAQIEMAEAKVLRGP